MLGCETLRPRLRPRRHVPLGWVGLSARASAFFLVALSLAAGMVASGPQALTAAAASVVRSFGAANTAAGATLSATPTAATTPGDLLVALIRTRNTTAMAPVSSVTDPDSNHWVRATSRTQGSQADAEIWYAAAAGGLSTTQAVTVTVGGTSAVTSAIAFTVLDVSGAASGSPLDVIAANGGSTQPASTNFTATTTQASEIAIADIGWNTGTNLSVSGQTAGYSSLPTQTSTVKNTNAGEQGAWEALTATGPQGYSATLSSSTVAWTGVIATFKSAASQPVITGFSPSNGVVGTPVTITGSAFTGASAVKFNGTTATYSVTDDQHISTSVPAGASTGTITVTAPGGTGTSTTSFTVNPAPMPMITSLSTSSGVVGTPVTIIGSGLTGASAVKFNGTTATYSVTDDQHISTSVPAGASTGTITVTTPGGTATSAQFTVNPSPTPTITTFSPLSGPVTTPVTITGTGLTGASAVKFNGTGAAFSVTDDSHISSSVPSGATTGLISVTTPGGTAMSATAFSVTSPPSKPHIMVIVEENRSYTGAGGVIGSSQAPYINGLASTYLSATNWYSPYHGSPLDYMALLAGNTDGSLNKPAADTTLADELTSAGITWKAYMETMQTDCETSKEPPGSNGSTALYAPDHNPFLYYSSTRTTSACQNNVPYSQFATDLNNNALPDFMFVVPNQCDEMHSECPPGKNTEVAQGDAWLMNNLPTILGSSWYQQGGVVIITWDEGFHTDNAGWVNGAACPSSSNCGGGTVPTIVVSAANAALSNHNYATGGNLYGILRGIEEDYGVGLLGSSADAGNGDLEPAFGPTTTGSISGTVRDSITGAVVGGATVAYSGGSTTTAGDGTYTLSNVTAGSYTVTASDTGYASDPVTNVSVAVGVTTTQNFTLMPNQGTISGTVKDSVSGNGIVGASVDCTGTMPCTGTMTSDSTGDYILSGLTEGSYEVTASKSGYSSQTFTVNVGPGGTPTQNFQLILAPGTITGTVKDMVTSTGIGGASVACTGSPSCTGTTSASDGTYTLTVPPGTYTITASASGYATGSISNVVVSTGNATPEDFELATAAGLSVVNTFGSSNATQSTTLSASPTSGSTGSGDLLVVTVKGRSSPLFAVTGVSDNSGSNTWYQATSTHNGQAFEAIYYAPDAAGVNSVTVTTTGVASLSMTVVDITGASATSPFDQAGNATGSTAAASAGTTASTNYANEIVIADIGWNGKLTLSNTSAGYTTLAPEQSTAMNFASGEEAAWIIVSTTGPQSFGGSLSSALAWTGAIATFH